MPLCKVLLLALAVSLGRPGLAGAQDSTRAGRLEAARRAKAASMQPPTISFTERAVRFVKESNFVEDNKLVFDLPSIDLFGIHPWIGGLGSGAGRAVGLRYSRRGGAVRLRPGTGRPEPAAVCRSGGRAGLRMGRARAPGHLRVCAPPLPTAGGFLRPRAWHDQGAARRLPPQRNAWSGRWSGPAR